MNEEGSMRRWVVAGFVGVVAVALVAVIASGVLGSGAASPEQATPLPPVAPSGRVVAEARVVPAASAVLSAAIPGVVSSLAVDEGDRVSSGALILQLDSATAGTEVAAAEAGVAAAAARSDQAAAVAKQAAAEVERAKAVVQGARAARDQLPSGSSTARKRAANAETDAAVAGLAAARAAEAAAVAASRAATSDEARAAAVLDAARKAAVRLAIVTPIDGTVAEIAVTEGDVVAAGRPLAQIAGDGGWIFETTDLAQDEVAMIAVGDVAEVTVDGFADSPIAGRVARVDAIGDDRQGDVVFAVVVEPTGEVPDGLRWKMRATVEIEATP